MKEIYKIEHRVVYDPEKGISPFSLAAILRASTNKSAAIILDNLQSNYNSKLDINAFNTKDFSGFLEYLISHIEDNTPKNMTSLVELDSYLSSKVKDYLRIKDILTKFPRSIFVHMQGKSPYAETTPLLLYAFKRAGYNYMHWDLEDRALPSMLGSSLSALIGLRKNSKKFKEVLEEKHRVAIEKGTPWQWLDKKSFPNPASVKSFAAAYAKLGGEAFHFNSVTVAIHYGIWCNFDNPNNGGIGIYSFDDWDYVPEHAGSSALEVLKSNSYGLENRNVWGGEIW